MNIHEWPNQNNKKSKNELIKESMNPPRQFFNKNKKKIPPSHSEFKPKDKNEIIHLLNENKEQDKNVENYILPSLFNSKNSILNISLSQSSFIENNKNTFPKGTDYEEQLNQYFQYFNVFWYDPNNTSEYKLFEKCFEKVEFYGVSDFNKIL